VTSRTSSCRPCAPARLRTSSTWSPATGPASSGSPTSRRPTMVGAASSARAAISSPRPPRPPPTWSSPPTSTADVSLRIAGVSASIAIVVRSSMAWWPPPGGRHESPSSPRLSRPVEGRTMSVDLVIKGGRIVSPDGIYEAAVAADGGRIVGIGEPGAMPQAKRVIDAGGQYVFPGIIDPHIHLQTFTNKFDINVKTETKSAAVGGCTTIIPTLLNREDATVSFRKHFPWCQEAVRKYASIDVGFSVVMGTDDHIREMPY